MQKRDRTPGRRNHRFGWGDLPKPRAERAKTAKRIGSEPDDLRDHASIFRLCIALVIAVETECEK
jgi:hypothetical protein